VSLRLNCKNDQCNTSVKNFKVKLFRMCYFSVKDKQEKTVEMLHSIKMPGCQSKENTVREVEFLIPKTENGMGG
jgi:hypothetical protein